VHLDRVAIVVVVAHMECQWASSQWRTEADLQSKRDQRSACRLMGLLCHFRGMIHPPLLLLLLQPLLPLKPPLPQCDPRETSSVSLGETFGRLRDLSSRCLRRGAQQQHQQPQKQQQPPPAIEWGLDKQPPPAIEWGLDKGRKCNNSNNMGSRRLCHHRLRIRHRRNQDCHLRHHHHRHPHLRDRQGTPRNRKTRDCLHQRVA